MQLIYRGHAYTYTSLYGRTAVRPYPQSTFRFHSISDPKPTHQPRAINWRYRLPGATQVEMPSVKRSTASRSVKPRAINWRYRIPAEV